jgi:uroporphyrinogen decarboxylase
MSNLVDTLRGEITSTPPVWLMRQAGRYLPEYQAIRQKVGSFMDLCFNEELATEVTLQPLRRFNLDAAILFCDILVIPHVLGQKVDFIPNQGPVLTQINDEFFFERAREINLLDCLQVPLRILKNVRESLPPEKAIIGFAGSPWTIATYMLEGGKSRVFSRITNLLKTGNPLFLNTMAILEEAVGTFLIAQIEAGANVVQIFDSWAHAVPQNHQQEWIVEPARRLIERIHKDYPGTPIIYYGRGVSCLYGKIANGLKNIAFGVDEDVPLITMKEQIQVLAPVQGNLSPQILVQGGDILKDNVTQLLDTFEGTPYVFNLGHGVLPNTPVEHVESVVAMVKER